jgi:hypothetical protein
MTMWAAITKAIKSKWQRLTRHTGTRRLSWFALLLVFALDGYVLSLLFEGTQHAGRTIAYPVHPISDNCATASQQFLARSTPAERAVAIGWFVTAVKDNKAAVSNSFSNTYDEIPAICVQIRDKWLAAIDNAMPQLRPLAEERKALETEIDKVESEIKELKSSYSTALLEKIARQSRSDSILPADATHTKSTIDELTETLAALKQQQHNAAIAMAQNPHILAYLQYLASLPIDSEFKKEEIRYESWQFWYPLKVLGIQAVFILIPLLFAIFWNAYAIKRQQDTQILVSSHIILVCAIPMLLRLLYFVEELLPEELLYWLLRSLEQWRLGFIWYYLLIFACIAGGLLLIYIAQRTLFSTARLRLIRLRKAQCQHCGEKLRGKEQGWCEVCGASQTAPCRQCGQPRRLLAFHCSHCGTSA